MSGCAILVPLDGSDFAEQAIGPAVAMSRILDAGLELVSVLPELNLFTAGDPAVAAMPALAPQQEMSRLQLYLEEVAADLKKRSVSKVSTALLRGKVSRSLEEYGKRKHCTVVVMCTHGRGPLSRAWLGSVTDELVRHADVPVLVVRPDAKGDCGFPVDGEFKKILVPLDGTDLAEQCLDWAITVARVERAVLDLVWVTYPNDQIPSPSGPGISTRGDASEEEHRRVALKYVEEKAVWLREEGIEVNALVTSAVQVAPEILHQTQALKSDLIVIATRGRGGLARAALGSVTDKVVRGAAIPVFVVRRPFL